MFYVAFCLITVVFSFDYNAIHITNSVYSYVPYIQGNVWLQPLKRAVLSMLFSLYFKSVERVQWAVTDPEPHTSMWARYTDRVSGAEVVSWWFNWLHMAAPHAVVSLSIWARNTDRVSGAEVGSWLFNWLHMAAPHAVTQPFP